MKKILLIALSALLLAGVGYSVYHYTKRPYIFVPYESSTLADKKSALDQKTLQEVEKRIQEIQKIIATFDEKTPLKDKNSTYFILSSEQQSIGRLLDAKKTLETTLKMSVKPNMLQAYALLLYSMGAKEPAMKYIDDALDLSPEVPDYWRSKIEMVKEMQPNNTTYLHLLYQEALSATHENINIITVYAQFLSDIGKREEAIQYWEKAIKKVPEEKDIYQQQIDVLKKQL